MFEDWNLIHGNHSHLVRRLTKTYRFSHIFNSNKKSLEVNRFNKLHPRLHLCEPLGLPSPNQIYFQPEAAAQWEWEFCQDRFTKAPSTSFSHRRCPLWGAKRTGKQSKGAPEENRREGEVTMLQEGTCWGKVHTAAAIVGSKDLQRVPGQEGSRCHLQSLASPLYPDPCVLCLQWPHRERKAFLLQGQL